MLAMLLCQITSHIYYIKFFFWSLVGLIAIFAVYSSLCYRYFCYCVPCIGCGCGCCVHFYWKISSTNCFVIMRWGLVGSTFGFWYNLALMAYNCGDRSQRTLNHQSHTNTACENWVPFGQRKLAWRPSISQ